MQNCLETAGKQFTIYGRDRNRSEAEFGVGNRNYNSSAGQALWVDDDGTVAIRRWTTFARPPGWPMPCRESTSSARWPIRTNCRSRAVAVAWPPSC